MVTAEIRTAGRDDFPAIARLFAEQNETPESQCLHSGEGYECGQGDELLGYVYAIVDESFAGYIDSLGARADVRGQGLGKRLLLSALCWLFDIKRVPEVGLTVSDDQVNARSL